jgi:hypothetical protein
MKISLVMGNLVLAEDLITLAGQNITIGSGTSITIPENKTLTLSEGAQMVVNGAIVVNGKINLRNGATLTAHDGLNVTTDVENSLVKYVDGKYIVKDAVAKIGNTYYETLADALTAAKTGETITLVDNVVVKGNLIIENSITINLNGNNIEGEGLVAFTAVKFEGNGQIIVPNGNIAIPNMPNTTTEGVIPVKTGSTEDDKSIYELKHIKNQASSEFKYVEEADPKNTENTENTENTVNTVKVLNVVFRPVMEGVSADVNNKVLGGDSGLDFIITIYAADTVVFRGTIADTLVKQAYTGNYALSLNIKGLTETTDYKVTLTLVSETGSRISMVLATPETLTTNN